MFSHKLMNGIQRQTIIRLPATLMICSIVLFRGQISDAIAASDHQAAGGRLDQVLPLHAAIRQFLLVALPQLK
jgi:hypothetical protein